VALGGKSINLGLRFVSNVRTNACPSAGCGAVNSTALRAVTLNGNGTGASSRLVSSISRPLITSPGHSGASATKRPWLALCDPNGSGFGSPGRHEVDTPRQGPPSQSNTGVGERLRTTKPHSTGRRCRPRRGWKAHFAMVDVGNDIEAGFRGGPGRPGLHNRQTRASGPSGAVRPGRWVIEPTTAHDVPLAIQGGGERGLFAAISAPRPCDRSGTYITAK